MGEILITRRGGLGGAVKNVLTVLCDNASATITATLGSTVLTTVTDSSGYAFFTNLAVGTWTVRGTKSGLTDCSKTITVSNSQDAYHIDLFFARFLYNGDYGEAGSSGANLCSEYSHGWSGSNPVYKSDYVSASANGGGHFFNGMTGAGSQATLLAEAVDLANYHTLHITSQASRIDTSKTWYIKYPNTPSGNSYYKWVGTVLAQASLSSTDIETITIDVSNLSQRKVIINFELSYNVITLYKMWLD